jgi:hypothetical protein
MGYFSLPSAKVAGSGSCREGLSMRTPGHAQKKIRTSLDLFHSFVKMKES